MMIPGLGSLSVGGVGGIAGGGGGIALFIAIRYLRAKYNELTPREKMAYYHSIVYSPCGKCIMRMCGFSDAELRRRELQYEARTNDEAATENIEAAKKDVLTTAKSVRLAKACLELSQKNLEDLMKIKAKKIAAAKPEEKEELELKGNAKITSLQAVIEMNLRDLRDKEELLKQKQEALEGAKDDAKIVERKLFDLKKDGYAREEADADEDPVAEVMERNNTGSASVEIDLSGYTVEANGGGERLSLSTKSSSSRAAAASDEEEVKYEDVFKLKDKPFMVEDKDLAQMEYERIMAAQGRIGNVAHAAVSSAATEHKPIYTEVAHAAWRFMDWWSNIDDHDHDSNGDNAV